MIDSDKISFWEAGFERVEPNSFRDKNKNTHKPGTLKKL